MDASHLLDTSVYCQPIKPRPLSSVMNQMEKIGDHSMSISVICELEILSGIYRKQAFRQMDSYERLLKNRFEIFTVDWIVAETAAKIQSHRESKGAPLSPFDLLIAATAKAHNLILATLNIRHFTNIEGLTVEDWSK